MTALLLRLLTLGVASIPFSGHCTYVVLIPEGFGVRWKGVNLMNGGRVACVFGSAFRVKICVRNLCCIFERELFDAFLQHAADIGRDLSQEHLFLHVI